MIAVTEQGVAVSNGCGFWRVSDPLELWRLMWGAVAFAMALQGNGGACPGCGCEASPCEYCLHECWLD
jgi:hypothetical protein